MRPAHRIKSLSRAINRAKRAGWLGTGDQDRYAAILARLQLCGLMMLCNHTSNIHQPHVARNSVTKVKDAYGNEPEFQRTGERQIDQPSCLGRIWDTSQKSAFRSWRISRLILSCRKSIHQRLMASRRRWSSGFYVRCLTIHLLSMSC